MRNRIAVAVAVAFPITAGAQNWELIDPPNATPSAVGCSYPDVLGHSVCIAVDRTRRGPVVWLFGDRDALWDTVTLSVDDGEIFVALYPHDPRPEWTAGDGGRLIRALQMGAAAFVSTGVDDVFVDLAGAARVIDYALAE